MNAALQKAIECIRIHDVYLRWAFSELGDGFEPKYDTEVDELLVQFKHVVTKTAVLELIGNGEEQQLFRVYIELGARWVEPHPEGERDGEFYETDAQARIEGIMVAEYIMQENPGKEALNAFAMHNASYHVWPYWREFLASQCVRMNLPKITLPAVQFGVNRQDSPVLREPE